MANEFFWYDVMTTDTKAAARFYADVVGWGTQEVGGDMEYTMFTVDGQGVAGLMPIPDEVVQHGGKPAWLGYIHVDDVDEAAEALKREGGTVHREPFTVPDTIRLAVVSDPQGAGFYLAKGLSKEVPEDLPAGTPGTIGWRELYAGDDKAALAFYGKMFGWTETSILPMGEMGDYHLFATGGSDAVGGIMTRPPAIPRSFWGYYFNVPAIDSAAGRVKAGGGAVVMGPQEVPGGQWIIQCTDPQGANFALVAPAR